MRRRALTNFEEKTKPQTTRKARPRVPQGPDQLARRQLSLARTECLIDQRFAHEDLADVLMIFESEKFLKFLFQSVRIFLVI